MKVKRVLTLVLAMTMVLSVITACGTKADTTAVADTSGAANSETTTATTTATTEAKPVTITYTSWGQPEDVIQEQIDEFNKTYPNITVEYSFLLYTDYVNKLKIDYAAGNAPDCADFQTGAMLKNFSSQLEPMDDHMAELWGNEWKSKFVEAGLDQAYGGGNVLYGIPINLSLCGTMWVYKAKLDKYGLSMPKNMDELKQVSEVLKANGEESVMIGAKDSWINIDQFSVMACDFSPEKYYGAIEGEVSWEDPDMVAALQAWQSLFTDKIVQEGALGASSYPTVIQDNWQKAAIGTFLPCGDWNIEQYMLEPLIPVSEENNLVVEQFPDVNGDGKPCPVTLTVGNVVGINVNASQEVKDACLTWIKWMAKEGREMQAKKGYFLPAFKEADVEYAIAPSGTAVKDKYDELAAYAVGPRELPYPELATALGDTLQKVAAGQDVAQAAKDLENISKSIERN